jgi:hypothetical protein
MEGTLALNDQELASLDPREYGKVLGQALFSDPIKTAFSNARVRSADDLHFLLEIEDETLRALHWQRLYCPIDNGWWPVAREQRVSFALHVPTAIDRRFPEIRRADLRMLILVANPSGLADYNLPDFDAPAAIAAVRSALMDAVPVDVLGSVSGAAGPATLDELAQRLTRTTYPLLHVVCHGAFKQAAEDTVLYLSDSEQRVKPVRASELVERLRPVARLPYLTFLASCDSAAPAAEKGVGGLAQRMVRSLGLPAVVAMTDRVTVATVHRVARAFYEGLLHHGQVDRALAEAYAGLADQPDIQVPALISALGGRPLFVDAPAERGRRVKAGAAPVASISEEGPVSLDSTYYIERQAERDVLAQLQKPGVTVTIKGHQQVGKTSLLVRLLAWCQGQGRATCFIDFRGFDAENRKNPPDLFREIGRSIAAELGLEEEPDVWKKGHSLILYLTEFVEKRVLAQIRAPILLLFDNADAFFDLKDVREDLFATLRGWHNKRATDLSGRRGWRRVGMVICHGTDPALWIEDLNQSPFNVSMPFGLNDFDEQEVTQLNERCIPRPLASSGEVARLLALVGGHPYLTRLALDLLSYRGWTLARLEADAAKQGGPFDSHLSQLYTQVSENGHIAAAFRQILATRRCGEKMYQKLWSIGLVRGDSCEAVSFRYKIYEDYFKAHPA